MPECSNYQFRGAFVCVCPSHPIATIVPLHMDTVVPTATKPPPHPGAAMHSPASIPCEASWSSSFGCGPAIAGSNDSGPPNCCQRAMLTYLTYRCTAPTSVARFDSNRRPSRSQATSTPCSNRGCHPTQLTMQDTTSGLPHRPTARS